MFCNRAIYRILIYFFVFFLIVSNSSYSQSKSDSLTFQLPEWNAWDNPLVLPLSGLYLNLPSNLQPKFEYDAETKLYSLENNIGGFRITNINKETSPDKSNISINFPYNNLPDYLKENNHENDVFLIQDKLQLSYTFKVTEMVKDTGILDSRII